MKKSILLMNTNLEVGGISASMINTANELSKYYDVSIFCLDPKGILKDKLSKDVKILDSSWRLRAICANLANAKKLGTKFYIYKVFARIWSVLFDNRLPIYIAISHQDHLGSFDLACSYTHEAEKHIEYTGLIRILLRKVNSPMKLSWVHCDYNFVARSRFNDRYYNKVDAIVGVSKSVSKAFSDTHPYVHTRIETCPNMLDFDNIYKLSNIPLDINFDPNVINCFSACRLSKIKGIPRAIKAFKSALIENNVYWYIAGGGADEKDILDAIEQYDLREHVILLGEKTNPFNYLKNADLYINVSYQEAAPLVFMEAKALHVPVFATNTLSAKELLDESVDYICDNDEESMSELFFQVTSSKHELQNRKKRLEGFIGNNRSAVDVFDKWMKETNEK